MTARLGFVDFRRNGVSKATPREGVGQSKLLEKTGNARKARVSVVGRKWDRGHGKI